MIAHHGMELAAAAEAAGVPLKFEAAVAGGIPVIKGLREGVAANELLRLYGILNGTCNYILSTMERTGRDFAEVLQDAQQLGYAEADPTFDVEGVDAAHKLAILAAIGFGAQVDFDAVEIEGITRLRAAELERLPTADPGDRRNRAYLRFTVTDRPGVLAEISAAMRDAGVSIESLIQQGRPEEGGEVLIAMVTHEGPERGVSKALALLDGSPSLTEAPLVMRLLG
jgi:homoserine dehydrogenase